MNDFLSVNDDSTALVSGPQTRRLKKLRIDWCPGWESHHGRPLKIRKLFILRNARNAKNAQIAGLGYTAGTRKVD
jgi:hypothetical protein